MVRGKTLEELDAERKRRIENIQTEVRTAAEATMTEEQTKAEEKDDAFRTLGPFDQNIRTLVDEVGELVEENVDAAASVMRQWIGNMARMED